MASSPDPEVLGLVAAGLSVSRVAKQTGLTRRRVRSLLARQALAAAADGLERDGERQVELEHLGTLRAAITPAALRGDVAAVRELRHISTARARLLDLGMVRPPVAPPTDSPREEDRFVDELRERRAARRAAPD